MKPSGIEPATFRFVAQHLNHCATAAKGLNQKGCRSDAYFRYVDLHILTQNILLTLESYWSVLFRICSFIHSFIFLSIAFSKASCPQSGIGCSSFSFQYPLFSWRSSSSCLRLFHRLTGTYICPSIFPSITYFRRQFPRTMWPIQLTTLHFIVYSIFLSSLTVCNTYSFFTRSAQMIFSILPLHKISNLLDISDLLSDASKL